MPTKPTIQRRERSRPASKPIVDEHDRAGAVTLPEHERSERRRKSPDRRPRRAASLG